MSEKKIPDPIATTPKLAGRPQRLSLVVYSEEADKVHYAFAMASAAAAVNVPATLFFTMGAIRALMATDSEGLAGWAKMTTGDGRSGGALDDDYRERGVATFEELIQACAALGVRTMVCEMGLRAIDLQRADLRDDIDIAEGGLVTFYSDAGDGPITFL